jgi:ATP-dependent RNA helicase DDX5/DBP2
MFSATWPPEIKELADQFCSMAPIQIQIGGKDSQGMDSGLTVNTDITQTIHVIDNNYEKYERLTGLLAKLGDNNRVQLKVIIFCQTKVGVDTLEKSLRNDHVVSSQMNFEVRGIHGDKAQYNRDDIYRNFKKPLSESFFET